MIRVKVINCEVSALLGTHNLYTDVFSELQKGVTELIQ